MKPKTTYVFAGSVESAKQGGLGRWAITMLREKGILARICLAPYEGLVGIEVERGKVRAAKALLGL